MAKGIQRTRYVDASKLYDSNDDEFLAKRGTRHRQDNGLLLSTDFILAMFRETAVHALDIQQDAIAALAVASGKSAAECEALAVLFKPLQSPEFDEKRVANDDIREIEIRLRDADAAVRVRRAKHYKQGENRALTERQNGLADIVSLSPILRDKGIPKRPVVVKPQMSNREASIVNTGIPANTLHVSASADFLAAFDTLTTIPPCEPQTTSINYRPRWFGGTGEDCGQGKERNGLTVGESIITPAWSIPTLYGSGAVHGEQLKHDSSSVIAMVNR